MPHMGPVVPGGARRLAHSAGAFGGVIRLDQQRTDLFCDGDDMTARERPGDHREHDRHAADKLQQLHLGFVRSPSQSLPTASARP
jgi:hypothetical protein